LKEEQENGIRVNDPNNPGRTYLSGKGLDFPVSLKQELMNKLQAVRQESEAQAREMVNKAAEHIRLIDPDLHLSYDYILDNYTKGMVRERHIAKAIRLLIFSKYSSDSGRFNILEKLYGGKKPTANIEDSVAVDGEIRSVLLKTGGVAFVKEDPKAFLEVAEIAEVIKGAGGIPCYPVLLDDAKGGMTDFEKDYDALHSRLSEMDIYSIELIPGRNSIDFLVPFVEFFNEKGFIITLGTEHNTPAMEPLSVSAIDGPLNEFLQEVNYKGACVIVAHQYLRSHGEQGYLDENGKPVSARDEFVELGNAIINQLVK
jgi:hypothetical protein